MFSKKFSPREVSIVDCVTSWQSRQFIWIISFLFRCHFHARGISLRGHNVANLREGNMSTRVVESSQLDKLPLESFRRGSGSLRIILWDMRGGAGMCGGNERAGFTMTEGKTKRDVQCRRWTSRRVSRKSRARLFPPVPGRSAPWIIRATFCVGYIYTRRLGRLWAKTINGTDCSPDTRSYLISRGKHNIFPRTDT